MHREQQYTYIQHLVQHRTEHQVQHNRTHNTHINLNTGHRHRIQNTRYNNYAAHRTAHNMHTICTHTNTRYNKTICSTEKRTTQHRTQLHIGYISVTYRQRTQHNIVLIFITYNNISKNSIIQLYTNYIHFARLIDEVSKIQ